MLFDTSSMAHLHIDPNPETISLLLLSSLFISLILITLLLIKCMRHATNPSVSLVNASTSTLNKIIIDPAVDDTTDFSHSSKTAVTIIIDENTLKELDTQSMPCDNKNASMVNLLQSHTRQSSFQNDVENSRSVSTENIPISHAQKPNSASSLATPRDKSVKSLDSSIVLENVTSTHPSGSVSRDNSPVPDYDEVS